MKIPTKVRMYKQVTGIEPILGKNLVYWNTRSRDIIEPERFFIERKRNGTWAVSHFKEGLSYGAVIFRSKTRPPAVRFALAAMRG